MESKTLDIVRTEEGVQENQVRCPNLIKVSSNWCQQFRNLYQIGVNNSKIWINWCQQLQIFTGLERERVIISGPDFGAVDTNLIQILELLTPIGFRF